jgi:hypothetical protein
MKAMRATPEGKKRTNEAKGLSMDLHMPRSNSSAPQASMPAELQ